MFVLYMYLVCDNKSPDKYNKGVYLSAPSCENGSMMSPRVKKYNRSKNKNTNKRKKNT